MFNLNTQHAFSLLPVLAVYFWFVSTLNIFRWLVWISINQGFIKVVCILREHVSHYIIPFYVSHFFLQFFSRLLADDEIMVSEFNWKSIWREIK